MAGLCVLTTIPANPERTTMTTASSTNRATTITMMFLDDDTGEQVGAPSVLDLSVMGWESREAMICGLRKRFGARLVVTPEGYDLLNHASQVTQRTVFSD